MVQNAPRWAASSHVRPAGVAETAGQPDSRTAGQPDNRTRQPGGHTFLLELGLLRSRNLSRRLAVYA